MKPFGHALMCNLWDSRPLYLAIISADNFRKDNNAEQEKVEGG